MRDLRYLYRVRTAQSLWRAPFRVHLAFLSRSSKRDGHYRPHDQFRRREYLRWILDRRYQRRP